MSDKKPKVFFSFHFDGDAWRTQTVRKIGVLEGEEPVEPNAWEKVKGSGDKGIESWIDRQLKDCDCLIVLVGAETAKRPWVMREIAKAWDGGIPVFGIRVHRLLDSSSKPSTAGDNPFDGIKLKNGEKLSQHLKLHDPAGATSKDVYATIADNIAGWIKTANRRKLS